MRRTKRSGFQVVTKPHEPSKYVIHILLENQTARSFDYRLLYGTVVVHPPGACARI